MIKPDFLQFLGTIFILSMLSDLECLISFLLLSAGTNSLAFYGISATIGKSVHF